MFFSFKKRFQSRPSPRQPQSSRLMLEALEDRMLLSPTLVTNTTVSPASAVVEVVATFPNGDRGFGTGTMVNQNTVLTAGHMVYRAASGGFAQSIEVIAGRNGTNAPYGIAYMTPGGEETFNSFIADDKLNSDSHSPGDGDIGFISLDRNLGAQTGYLGFLATSGSNASVYKLGYPAADGYDGTQMYFDYGAFNEHEAGSVSGFAYWGWSSSSMSAIPGESGSSLILDQNGQIGIIGVQEAGPESGSGEGYAEVTTQAVINALVNFEQVHPPIATVGSPPAAPSPPPPAPSPPPAPTPSQQQNNPSPSPNLFNEAATDALMVAQGLHSGNTAAAYSAWEDFVSLYAQSSAALQPQLWQVFYDDFIADWG